jgi:hypothetical protein
MAAYRSLDTEIEAAERARKLLYEVDEIHGMLGPDDPLRRALQIVHRALVVGLWASPVLPVDRAATVLEMQLPHGSDALQLVDEYAERNETLLQTLYERALALPSGGAARRKVLIQLLVDAATHLHAVLLGLTRAGVLVREDATAESFQRELEKLCAVADAAEFQDVASLPSYLYSTTANLLLEYRLRYGINLDFDAAMNALVGLIQNEERLRREQRTERSGPRAEGGVNDLDAVLTLLDLAGVKARPAPGDKDARERAVEVVQRDLHAARALTRKFTSGDDPPRTGKLDQDHEDSTSSGCAERRGPGTSA